MATVKMTKIQYKEIELDLMQLDTDGSGQIVDYEFVMDPPDPEATRERETPKNPKVGSVSIESDEDLEEVVKK